MNFNEEFLQEPTPERSVAEVLRLVSASDHYRRSLERGYGMCHALYYAASWGIITRGERIRAGAGIQLYMDYLFPDGPAYMCDVLRHAGLPHDNKALIDLYSDWENKNV